MAMSRISTFAILPFFIFGIANAVEAAQSSMRYRSLTLYVKDEDEK